MADDERRIMDAWPGLVSPLVFGVGSRDPWIRTWLHPGFGGMAPMMDIGDKIPRQNPNDAWTDVASYPPTRTAIYYLTIVLVSFRLVPPPPPPSQRLRLPTARGLRQPELIDQPQPVAMRGAARVRCVALRGVALRCVAHRPAWHVAFG